MVVAMYDPKKRELFLFGPQIGDVVEVLGAVGIGVSTQAALNAVLLDHRATGSADSVPFYIVAGDHADQLYLDIARCAGYLREREDQPREVIVAARGLWQIFGTQPVS